MTQGLGHREVIDPSKIRYSPTIRLFDPNGRVFFYDGRVYRGVYPHRVEFVKRLFAEHVVQPFAGRKLLIGTYLTEKRLDGFGLILEHDQVEVVTRPKEWSFVTYIEAAKSYLKLFRELHIRGLALIDGHCNNFSLAPGGRVVWHDFGSIIEARKDSLSGLGEFLTEFYYPLRFYRRIGYFPIMRRMGLHCGKDDYYRLTSHRLFSLVHLAHQNQDRYWAKGIRKAYSLFSNRYLASAGTTEFARFIMSKLRGEAFEYRHVRRFIDSLYREICDIPIRFNLTQWGDYHQTSNLNQTLGKPRGKRQTRIFEALKDIKPSRVLDLGANQGVFSHLASQVSPCVISSDLDETAVAKHAYTMLSMNKDSHIYPVLFNAIQMSDDVINRYRSHTVMALALTHHLRLSQRFPFGFIAKMLSRVTEKVLLTEFMPNGLGGLRKHPDPLPDDYTLESFLLAFQPYFRSVEVIDYDIGASNSPRTLVICRKREA